MMPTYEYRCEKCGHHLEEYQSITAPPLKRCPACGKSALCRLIGTGGGIIFKGSGFYETDYRSESYRKAAEAEKSPAKSADGDGKSGQSTGSGGKRAEKKPAKAAGGSGSSETSAA
jgi:putative FmdB family regulatory protein